MSIDEAHEQCEQFGINDICKVTPKEGGDSVRIARPLETAAGKRQLSEELLGIVLLYRLSTMEMGKGNKQRLVPWRQIQRDSMRVN